MNRENRVPHFLAGLATSGAFHLSCTNRTSCGTPFPSKAFHACAIGVTGGTAQPRRERTTNSTVLTACNPCIPLLHFHHGMRWILIGRPEVVPGLGLKRVWSISIPTFSRDVHLRNLPKQRASAPSTSPSPSSNRGVGPCQYVLERRLSEPRNCCENRP